MPFKSTPKEKLQNYISDLYEIGCRSFDVLNGEQKATITGLYMQTLSDSHRFEFLSETEVSDDLSSTLAKYLESFSLEAEEFIELKRNLLSIISAGAICYAEKAIDKLFKYEIEKNLENESFNQYEKGVSPWTNERLESSL